MDNTPALQDDFNQQNHLDKFILHANPETVDQIESVKKRTEEIHEKLKDHHARHWMIWVKKEQDSIFERKFGGAKPAYNYGSRSLTWDDARAFCFNEARVKINTRIKARHENLDITSQRMRDTVMDQARHRHQNQGMARQRLDHEVKEIHQSIHRKRMDAYRDFEANKIQRVEEARKNLSQTPERDVYESYKQQDIDILTQKEHLLTQTYEKHGFNYQMEKHALTQKFTQKL